MERKVSTIRGLMETYVAISGGAARLWAEAPSMGGFGQ
ncbi:hypothetical protein CEB3_c27180 [Peptococcaceae bacterium CEB3]|nr:hypothetical protein CEB3_c27180 [Peptococcaceae bacterium CEB3]